MISLPPEPAVKKPIIDWAIQAQKTLRALRPVAGPGIKITESANNLVISSVQTAGASAARLPWDIFSLSGVGTPDPGTGAYASYNAKVWPGTLNGLIPTNLVGTGGLEEFTFSGSGAIIFKVAAVTNGKAVTSCTIVADSAQPATQVPAVNALPTAFEVAFAVVAGGVAYRCLGPANITAAGEKLFVTDRTTQPAFGQLGYQSWYAWRITS